MAMVINSNIQSLNAQRHLNNSLDAQNTATERLSSGLRINSAKDDAAGLAIANRMTSQVQGLNQAVRNANDGAALIQTAEGGLEEMTNIMQRMRELSIQSANGTYDTGNRTTLNAEVTQLKAEIDRIAETTSFNGQNILDGSIGGISLQVGENANQTIALDIDSLKTNNIGANGGDLVGTAATASLLTSLQAVAGTGALFLEVNGDKVQSLSAAATLDEAVNKLSDSVAGVDISHFVELESDIVISGGNGALSGSDELILTMTASGATTSNIINIKDTTSLENLVSQIN
jgi:flagellin